MSAVVIIAVHFRKFDSVPNMFRVNLNASQMCVQLGPKYDYSFLWKTLERRTYVNIHSRFAISIGIYYSTRLEIRIEVIRAQIQPWVYVTAILLSITELSSYLGKSRISSNKREEFEIYFLIFPLYEMWLLNIRTDFF